MSMVMEMRGSSITPEQYDAVCAKVFADGMPDGLIAHVAGFDDDGLHVTDVWESEEKFQRFNEGELGPAMQEAGVDMSAPPSPPAMFPARRVEASAHAHA